MAIRAIIVAKTKDGFILSHVTRDGGFSLTKTLRENYTTLDAAATLVSQGNLIEIGTTISACRKSPFRGGAIAIDNISDIKPHQLGSKHFIHIHDGNRWNVMISKRVDKAFSVSSAEVLAVA